MKLKQKHFKSWVVKLGLLLTRPINDELAEVVFHIDSGIVKLSEPLWGIIRQLCSEIAQKPSGKDVEDFAKIITWIRARTLPRLHVLLGHINLSVISEYTSDKRRRPIELTVEFASNLAKIVCHKKVAYKKRIRQLEKTVKFSYLPIRAPSVTSTKNARP